MLKNFSKILTTAILCVMLFASCSKTVDTPLIPDVDHDFETPLSQSMMLSGHNILGEYTMFIDKENMEIEVVQNRDADIFHFNITWHLSNPPCPPAGCFQFKILEIDGTVLRIELKMANPTSLTVYDVRQVFTNLYGKTILNPDGYTPIFNPPSNPDPINPFIAYGIDNPERQVPGPWIIQTREVLLDFPAGMPSAVNYLFECSVGGNTEEPYQIENQQQYGVLPNQGGTTVILADVLDWQDDISTVTLDTSQINGRITNFSLVPDTSTYRAFVNNYLKRETGIYPALIKADSPNDLEISMYHYVDIEISDAPFSDNIPVSDCIDCDATTEAVGQRCIAINAPDIWIAYSDNRSGISQYHTRVQKSSNSGGSFQPSVQVSTSASNQKTLPSIAVYGNNVYVTWTWKNLFNSDIKFARSLDGGATFLPEAIPHPDPFISAQTNSHICVDGNGVIYIVYEEDNFGYGVDIAMVVSEDEGVSWSAPVRVNDDLTDKGQFSPSISADLLGNAAIVWEDKRSAGGAFTSGDIYFSTTDDKGQTFSPNVKINTTSGTGQVDPAPAIALYLTGGAYITWASAVTGASNIYFAYSSDRVNFGPNVRVNDDSGITAAQYDPSINVNIVGTIFIAWTDERNLHKDVFFAESRDGGVTFGENYIVNTDTTEENQFAPAIASDFLGRAYITWSDARNTRSKSEQEVFFAFRR